MVKRICILPLMEPDEYLPYAINSVIDSVDYLLFSVNERSWGDPNITLTDSNRQWITDLSKTNPKFRLMIGHWDLEHEQHNAGIEYAKSLGCEVVLCQACDQIYGPEQASKILALLDDNDYAAIRVKWTTFWKKFPLYVIDPPEVHTPVVAFRIDRFRYADVSEGIHLDKDGKKTDTAITALVPDANIFHFSFARDDDFMKKKMEMSSHKKETVPNWYEDVWLKWEPGMLNLHPCWPVQFKRAIYYPLSKLPADVRKLFEV